MAELPKLLVYPPGKPTFRKHYKTYKITLPYQLEKQLLTIMCHIGPSRIAKNSGGSHIRRHMWENKS